MKVKVAWKNGNNRTFVSEGEINSEGDFTYDGNWSEKQEPPYPPYEVKGHKGFNGVIKKGDFTLLK